VAETNGTRMTRIVYDLRGFLFPAETGEIAQKLLNACLTTEFTEVCTELFMAIGFWLLAFGFIFTTQNPEPEI
jgi:hypothetical protein